MLLQSCAGYLTNYQTPCVEGHVCECVQYTTLDRSWLDCRESAELLWDVELARLLMSTPGCNR
jgi:hypothetical protein